MSTVIELPIITTPSSYHYGSSANYDSLINCYFIKDNNDDTTTNNDKEQNTSFIYKHTIFKVVYKPDIIYQTTDGHWGRCWVVEVHNNDDTDEYSVVYYIRNWGDIVAHYKQRGFRFIKEI